MTEMQRSLTTWFINFGPPSTITLVPQVETKTPGKGVTKSNGTARSPQQFKKIWQGDDGLETSGDDGTLHRLNFVLVGEWDCKAAVGDIWYEGNQKYIIHSEYPYNGYERKFGVYSIGPDAKD